MKKIFNRLLCMAITLLCTFCLSIFTHIRYSGFSFCLFGEPNYDVDD